MSFPLGLLIKSVFFALRQHRRRETESAGYYSYTVKGETKFLIICSLLLSWWEFETQTRYHNQYVAQLLFCEKAQNCLTTHTFIRIGDKEHTPNSILAVGNWAVISTFIIHNKINLVNNANNQQLFPGKVLSEKSISVHHCPYQIFTLTAETLFLVVDSPLWFFVLLRMLVSTDSLCGLEPY